MSEKCETHGCELIDMCHVCGAPVCCPKCCIETLKEAFEELDGEKQARKELDKFKANLRRNGHY